MDRNSDGTFAKGNKGGPGRPKRQVEQDYYAKIGKICDAAEWAAIIAKAVEQAQGGCHRARSWLSKYLVPDPQIEQQQIETYETNPMEYLQEIQLRHAAGKKYRHLDRDYVNRATDQSGETG